MNRTGWLKRFPLTIQAGMLAAMLLGLPLIGPLMQGSDLSAYLEFPPQTRSVEHAPFSLPVFAVLGLFLLAVVLPPAVRLIRSIGKQSLAAPSAQHPFPWWGHAGLALGLADWVLAWTRFEWMADWQRFTFTPLWIAYILVINALMVKRTGSCLLLKRPGFFLLLFPASALFWWFFEYLNRFVQNWYYINVQDFSALEYTAHASLSFATVLPAVLSTRALLLTFPVFERTFGSFISLRIPQPKVVAGLILLLSGSGLAFIGVFPDVLFPLLWVSPLLIIVSVRTLLDRGHVLSRPARGDWSDAAASALAALVCGFFWEMWNVFSLAKWVYSIPYVEAVHIFEMPLLGYAGYLPFGLECVAVASLLQELLERSSSS